MRSLALTLIVLLAGCDGADPVDGGAADAGPVMSDAGAADAGVDASVSMCREDLRSPVTGVVCSMATADCAAACSDATCAQACFAADANAACLQCWDINQIACWNRNGCQDEWNCAAECIQDNCPGFTVACIRDNCQAQDLAYADCFEPLREMCLQRTVSCLP